MIAPNEGPLDRAIRVTVGLVLVSVAYLSLTGVVQIVAYVISAALIVTGAVGFCGIYALLGINTCPVKKTK